MTAPVWITLLALSQSGISSTAPGGCPSGGEAVPCELRVFVNDADGKVVPVRAGRVPISRRRDVELWVESWTQYGKQWPQEDAKYQLQTERGCPDRYQISNLTPHRFRVHVTSEDADRCGLRMIMTAPRQASVDLTPIWEAPPVVPLPGTAGAYSHGDAEYVVRRLYLALLARDPDPSDFASAVSDLQAGRLELVVYKIASNSEYGDLHRDRNSYQTVQLLYGGLLGRRADENGLRAYQPRVYRGDVVGVVLELLRSQEFRDRMAARQ